MTLSSETCALVSCIVHYREQPLINTRTVDVDYLRTLPEDTFGKAYANFLDTNVRGNCFLI